MKHKRKWELTIPHHGTVVREGYTLSEARALCKAALNLARLPIGTKSRQLPRETEQETASK